MNRPTAQVCQSGLPTPKHAPFSVYSAAGGILCAVSGKDVEESADRAQQKEITDPAQPKESADPAQPKESGKRWRRTPPRAVAPKQVARALRSRDRDREPETARTDGMPVIRRAKSRDLAALIALRALLFEAMGTAPQALSAAGWQREAQRWLQVNLQHPDVNITVADVNGSVVACAIGQVTDRMPSPGHPQGRVGILGNVVTFPEYRMGGLAQACIDAVMQWFREETDATGVELFATQEGRRRYLGHGFTDHEFPQLRVALPRADVPTGSI